MVHAAVALTVAIHTKSGGEGAHGRHAYMLIVFVSFRIM